MGVGLWKSSSDLTSAQAKPSIVVQGLRNQSQAGLLLLLCWEEEEGEGRETEPWGCAGVGMNRAAVTAQLEPAQPCGCAQLLVGPSGLGWILCSEHLNLGYRAWFCAQSMETDPVLSPWKPGRDTGPWGSIQRQPTHPAGLCKKQFEEQLSHSGL